jgi:hypothetical protein
MRPVVKTCIDYKPGPEPKHLYQPSPCAEKTQDGHDSSYTRQSWMFDTHHGKEDVMDILRDNDMHPQYVPFPTFVV